MMYRFFALLIGCLFISSCVAAGDNSLRIASPTAAISKTSNTQSPSEPTLTPSQKIPPIPASLSRPGPPICPDLPRPAMVFQAPNGEDYILRHVASKSECTMQFDPPISRLLALTADGIY